MKAPQSNLVLVAGIDQPSNDQVPQSVLDGDQGAWRSFVNRYDGPLRAVVRDATESTWPLSDDQVDDVLGDFWLLVVRDDMRLLRSFNPSRGSTLLTWLTFHVAQVASEHVQRLQDEPQFVPLEEAEHVPALPPRRSRRSAASKRGPDDASDATERPSRGIIDLRQEVIAALASTDAKRTIAAIVRETIDLQQTRRRATDEGLIDAQVAAELLAMTPAAVRKAAFRGSLPCRRLGRKLRFVRSELLAMTRSAKTSR